MATLIIVAAINQSGNDPPSPTLLLWEKLFLIGKYLKISKKCGKNKKIPCKTKAFVVMYKRCVNNLAILPYEKELTIRRRV